ncbi:hypothetical protein AVEN_855-1 [Araneus ventricosus]|uniref:Uncharacterized protein n=1 Tax=Araneus ventricosus TaxID=182803 RepID=A0A4Y2NVE1_ARAVE|nr:hypothetical protein AVEN_855-1 [Araneus ventricosus]
MKDSLSPDILTILRNVVNYVTISQTILSQTKSTSPLAHRKSNTIGERFMVKEESAASVGNRPWTPEERSPTLSVAFML